MPFSLSALPRPEGLKTYHTQTYSRISKHHGFNGSGKTVLVTGGAQGVGRSICKAFASTGVKRIVIINRSAGPQEEAKKEIESEYEGIEVECYQADVTDTARMENILQEVGAIDVLVLNAVIAHRRAEATAVTEKEVRDAFEVNAIAPFNLVKAYMATPMPASGKKVVLNISAAAVSLPGHYRVGYGPSKAAGVQIMQNFASRFPYPESRVKIISFHPGSFYTEGVAANIPKDMIEWEDINLPAHFCLWCAGPEGGVLHGRFVWAQWDVDELLAMKERVTKEPMYLTIGLIGGEGDSDMGKGFGEK